MRACMSLQVERVVEAFTAECAEVAFDVRVALHMPVEESLQAERFGAHAAREPATPVNKPFIFCCFFSQTIALLRN